MKKVFDFNSSNTGTSTMDKILKLIESKEKYFTFKLYRQHITFLKNKD